MASLEEMKAQIEEIRSLKTKYDAQIEELRGIRDRGEYGWGKLADAIDWTRDQYGELFDFLPVAEQLLKQNEDALELINNYAFIDGAHHKQWLLDQIARKILGDGYEDWRKTWLEQDGSWTTDHWDEGIAP